MTGSIWRVVSFLLGPVVIILTLWAVSGDDHIHVAAPTVLLAIWFILDLIRYAIGTDGQPR